MRYQFPLEGVGITTEFIEQIRTCLQVTYHKRFLIEEFDHGSD
jgi:hypothetical protein